MIFLLRYLKKYKKESILAPLFKMLEACFELVVPLVMARIIDVGIASGNKIYIVKMCGIMVALGIIGLVCSMTAQFFSAKAAVNFGKDIREDLYKKIQSFSFTQLDNYGSSTLIVRLTSDINLLQSGVNLILRLFLRSPFIVMGAVIMAFYVDYNSAWIFVVAIPILAVVVFGIMFASIPVYSKVQEKLEEILLLTKENLEGIRIIRAFRKEKDEKEEFKTKVEELSNLQFFVGRISSFLNPVTYIVINLAIIAILWVGANQVNKGIITSGIVVALVNYMSQILVELIKLANLIISVTKSMASAKRVSQILNIESGMESGEDTSKLDDDNNLEILFQDVRFSYSGKGDNLKDINFQISKGQTMGIIGGTGAGKTTLISLISRFYDVTQGAILFNNKNIKEFDLTYIRKKVALVPQMATLFHGTIKENLSMGTKAASDETIWKALITAQGREFVDNLEHKLDSKVLQGGTNFSGGQKQRLTIARALVKDAPVIILDDSSSALDAITDKRLQSALKENMNDKIIFIVSQRISSIKNLDKILVLEDGRQVGFGTHADLIKSCNVYKEIYDSQMLERKDS